jgi:hypothetical protein
MDCPAGTTSMQQGAAGCSEWSLESCVKLAAFLQWWQSTTSQSVVHLQKTSLMLF